MDYFLLLTVFVVLGFFSVITGGVTVSVLEGDSLTLHTNVTATQHEEILWYFNDTRIAKITGDLSVICTDVQCNKGTERFRDRLELEKRTGSLSITDTSAADTGEYQLKIFSSRNISKKTFSVTVTDARDAKMAKVNTISVKEGESVTFDCGVTKSTDDVMTWYFNNTLLAEISGDQSQICSEDQCKERFRDRLKLDQTGSLTITNTRTTDSGLYLLHVNSHVLQYSVSVTSLKRFNFTVTDSGLSTAAVAGICAGVVLMFMALAAAAAGIYWCNHRPKENAQTEAGARSIYHVRDLDPDHNPVVVSDSV